MYLCIYVLLYRALALSAMLGMDYQTGVFPSLMRGFERSLLQGVPEFPWGYVPRIVH